MLVAYRFRLYPTRAQTKLMEQTLQTCRRLYNNLLAERNVSGTGFYALKASLVQRKMGDKYLRAVHSQVLQDVNLRLDKAMQAFFAGLAKYPKFKRRGRYNSFTYPQSGFEIVGDRLQLSKIGCVKVKLHREVAGTLKRVTIIKDVDHWFTCIMAEQRERTKQQQPEVERPPIGVDLGLMNLATLSDGTVFPNPRHLPRSIQRIKAIQKSLSKKRNGSHNRDKTKVLLAKAWRRVRRQRDDTAHKVSRLLADSYSTIVFEELKIPNMVKNHHLASAIMDSAWGRLRALTVYKAERRGGRVKLVDPTGTSQRCSGCGEVVHKELSIRVHDCPNCGIFMDRDVNAARNILERGLERARVEEQPLLVQRRISKFAPVKQEASGFIPR